MANTYIFNVLFPRQNTHVFQMFMDVYKIRHIQLAKRNFNTFQNAETVQITFSDLIVKEKTTIKKQKLPTWEQ